MVSDNSATDAMESSYRGWQHVPRSVLKHDGRGGRPAAHGAKHYKASGKERNSLQVLMTITGYTEFHQAYVLDIASFLTISKFS